MGKSIEIDGWIEAVVRREGGGVDPSTYQPI